MDFQQGVVEVEVEERSGMFGGAEYGGSGQNKEKTPGLSSKVTRCGRCLRGSTSKMTGAFSEAA